MLLILNFTGLITGKLMLIMTNVISSLISMRNVHFTWVSAETCWTFLDVKTLLYVLVMVQSTTNSDNTVNILIRLPCQVIHVFTFIIIAVVLILLCFTAVLNTLDVVYLFGKNYSKCLQMNSNANIILNCSAGQDWNYTGSTGNATERLIVVEPLPAPCEVC